MICYRLTSPKLTAVIGFHKKIYRYIRSHNIAKDYRVNQRIKVPEVRLVDEEGNLAERYECCSYVDDSAIAEVDVEEPAATSDLDPDA